MDADIMEFDGEFGLVINYSSYAEREHVPVYYETNLYDYFRNNCFRKRSPNDSLLLAALLAIRDLKAQTGKMPDIDETSMKQFDDLIGKDEELPFLYEALMSDEELMLAPVQTCSM